MLEDKDKNKNTNAAGQQDQDTDKSDNTDTSTDDKNQDDAVKTFTQEEVNRMMAKEKRQGRSSAYNDLGIDPEDKKAMALIRSVLASQKADEDEQGVDPEISQKLEEANRRAIIAETKADIMRLGIKPKYVEDATLLILAKKNEDNNLEDLVTEIKERHKSWFGDEEDDEDAGQSGTGSSLGRDQKKRKDQESTGERLAAQRAQRKPKKSFWGLD